MKKQTFNLLCICGLLCMASCDTAINNSQSASNGLTETEEDSLAPIPSVSTILNTSAPATNVDASDIQPITLEIDGSIHPTEWVPGQTSTITFNRFPTSATAFRQVLEKYGNKPEVAVLLQLMAFEIYNHNKEEGLSCIEMINVENNIDNVVRILKDRYNPAYGEYYTPQLVATFLKGTSPENAYKADKPFTIQVRTHKANKYQDSNTLKGVVLYLEVYSSGYDTHWRGISVVKSKGSSIYKVVNSPALYTQCQPVSFKTEEEYIDIWHQ